MLFYMKPNLIQALTFDFALSIVQLSKVLRTKKEFILSDQVLRSGTSIGANVEEALAGSSRRDFVHRLVIACREARETRYWLRLLEKSDIKGLALTSHLIAIEDILNILYRIIKTTKASL